MGLRRTAQARGDRAHGRYIRLPDPHPGHHRNGRSERALHSHTCGGAGEMIIILAPSATESRPRRAGNQSKETGATASISPRGSKKPSWASSARTIPSSRCWPSSFPAWTTSSAWSRSSSRIKSSAGSFTRTRPSSGSGGRYRRAEGGRDGRPVLGRRRRADNGSRPGCQGGRGVASCGAERSSRAHRLTASRALARTASR